MAGLTTESIERMTANEIPQFLFMRRANLRHDFGREQLFQSAKCPRQFKVGQASRLPRLDARSSKKLAGSRTLLLLIHLNTLHPTGSRGLLGRRDACSTLFPILT